MKIVRVKGIAPVSQGSISAYSAGIAVDTHAKKLKPWRKAIADAYKEQCGDFYEQYTPLLIEAEFILKPPKKPKCFLPSVKNADLDKLCRGLGDALTGVAYFDDTQICSWHSSKRYAYKGEEEGVRFRVSVLDKGEIFDSAED